VNSVQALVVQLRDREPIVRRQAARELGRRGRAGRAAVPALTRLVSDPYPEVGNQAARALVQIGPDGIDALVPLLSAAGIQPRVRAARALVHAGPDGRPAVPGLLAAVDANDPTLRQLAVRALGEIGPTAAPAADRLVRALEDPDAAIRGQAAKALALLGEPALPALRKALEEDNALVRMGALVALGGMGKEATPLLPRAVAALNDVDPGVRQAAKATLQVQEPLARPLAGAPRVDRIAPDTTRAERLRAMEHWRNWLAVERPKAPPPPPPTLTIVRLRVVPLPPSQVPSYDPVRVSPDPTPGRDQRRVSIPSRIILARVQLRSCSDFIGVTSKSMPVAPGTATLIPSNPCFSGARTKATALVLHQGLDSSNRASYKFSQPGGCVLLGSDPVSFTVSSARNQSGRLRFAFVRDRIPP
jgi:hypothetical protein